MPLPAKCPELNPVENVWQFMRDNWLSNRVFTSYENLLDHCCHAWNKLIDQPWTIMSIGPRNWTHRFRSKRLGIIEPVDVSGDGVSGLLAGNVQIMNEVVIYPHVKAGKVNLLAVNNPTRHWDFLTTPTLTEAGFPDADVPIWFSCWAPDGTSNEIIGILSQKIAEISRTPEMIQRLRDISFVPVIQTPKDMGAFFDRDLEANGKVIREANISLS